MKRPAALLALAVALIGSGEAQNAQTGVLQCRGGPRIGLIVGSFERLDCEFRPTVGPIQRYSAREGRIGLDVGITAASVMAWAVFAPTNRLGPGDLAGTYGGASADVALGLGVGANALIGGSARSIALQPLSIEGDAGVALALGVAGLTLVYEP
jgi:uncharacterized protein DUF992